MKESDLYVPVRDWLRARGYVVHIEVFDCDVVGIRESDGHMVAVELKCGMTASLYRQLAERTRWADEVWGAVPPTASKPKGGWSYGGYGLLIVKDGRARVRRQARPQPWHRVKSQRYRRAELASRRPAHDSHIAGLPTCKLAATQRHAVRYAEGA